MRPSFVHDECSFVHRREVSLASHEEDRRRTVARLWQDSATLALREVSARAPDEFFREPERYPTVSEDIAVRVADTRRLDLGH